MRSDPGRSIFATNADLSHRKCLLSLTHSCEGRLTSLHDLLERSGGLGHSECRCSGCGLSTIDLKLEDGQLGLGFGAWCDDFDLSPQFHNPRNHRHILGLNGRSSFGSKLQRLLTLLAQSSICFDQFSLEIPRREDFVQ